TATNGRTLAQRFPARRRRGPQGRLLSESAQFLPALESKATGVVRALVRGTVRVSCAEDTLNMHGPIGVRPALALHRSANRKRCPSQAVPSTLLESVI